ncbi:MAG TPA: phosphotransferase [Chloroflexota bacterium]|nr:phosphotransferase [Chloroflexota bacterium]
MTHTPLPAPFTDTVHHLLGQYWPGASLTRVDLLKDWNRSIVARCWLDTSDPAIPESVVAKQVKAKGDRGHDDWASLQFLSSLTGRFAPRFLAGDTATSLFLTEDLGAAPTLESVLDGDDPRASHDALLALARQVGAMQAASVGQEGVYTRMRSALSPITEPVRYERAREFQQGWDIVSFALTLLDETAPIVVTTAQAEFESIVRALYDPGDLLTFTHGDIAPSNTIVEITDTGGGAGITENGQCWLIDFEYGGYRHAFYDTIFWRVLCPLPEDLADGMDANYRRALALGCPAVEDERRYREARSGSALYGAWRMLIWHLRAAMERDHPWVGGMMLRQALIFHLHNAAAVAAQDDQFVALGDLSHRVATHLEQRWSITAEPKSC